MQAAAKTENLDAIVLLDRTGQHVVSTLVRPGDPLPKRDDMSPHGGVFAGNEAVSDLARGATTKRDVVLVSVPVIEGNSVTYALSAGIYVAQFNALFAEAGLEPRWLGIIADRKGHILARNKDWESHLGRLANPKLATIASDGQRAGLLDFTTYEGVAVSTSYRRSSASGWVSVVGVPQENLCKLHCRGCFGCSLLARRR